MILVYYPFYNSQINKKITHFLNLGVSDRIKINPKKSL